MNDDVVTLNGKEYTELDASMLGFHLSTQERADALTLFKKGLGKDKSDFAVSLRESLTESVKLLYYQRRQ